MVGDLVNFDPMTRARRKRISFLRRAGWKIVACSCACGGRHVWLKPSPSGAFEMVGCVCHRTPAP